MLNYLLVGAGFFLYGIAEVKSDGYRAAITLSDAGAATAFHFLDLITLRKIFNVKNRIADTLEAIGDRRSLLHCVLNQQGEGDLKPPCLRRDPTWTTLIAAVLAGMFLSLGVDSSLKALMSASRSVRATAASGSGFFLFLALLAVGLRNAKPRARKR
jgi:hypothetical protein